MDDFCPVCSTYLANASVCPTCGAHRAQSAGEGVELVASLRLDGEAQPGAVVAGNLIVTSLIVREKVGGAFGGAIVAADATTMRAVWRLALPDGLVNPPLVLHHDLVIFATQTTDPLQSNASLCAVELSSGRERWRWQPGMRAVGAPVLADDGSLWLVGDGNTFWTVAVATGTARRGWPLEGARHILPPEIHGPTLLTPTRGPLLLAVDSGDGRIVWRHQHSADAWAATPFVCGHMAFASFTDGAIAALDAATGAVLWTRPPAGRGALALASDGERLYIGGPGGVQAVAIATGTPVWAMPSERKVTARPLVAGATLIVAGHDHLVRGLDPTTGAEHWRWQGEHRIEIEPLPTPAGLAVFDADDALRLLRPPRAQPTLQQALDAGAWRVAASLLADGGKLADAARLLEQHNDAFAAAQLWAAAGQRRQAAGLFEKINTNAALQSAAELYDAEGDLVAKALALHRLAELSDAAEAWQQAQHAYKEAGMESESAAAWREVCRLRKYPFVLIEVTPETGFVKDQYNILHLLVRNEGDGVATALSAKSSGPFVGDDMRTTAIGNLAPGRSRDLPLGLQPASAGKVPLTLEVRFLLGPREEDRETPEKVVSRRIFVDVASTEAQRQSSADLAQQLNQSFAVIDRDAFRRTRRQIKEETLERLKLNLAEREGVRSSYGLAAPLWLVNEIRQLEQDIHTTESELDEMTAAGE